MSSVHRFIEMGAVTVKDETASVTVHTWQDPSSTLCLLGSSNDEITLGSP